MNKQHMYGSRHTGESQTAVKQKPQQLTFINDVKALIKAPVLIANMLPVFSGFWLALHFSNAAFYEWIGMCLLVLFGSTFVMAGALVLNNWYDADIDGVMDRTKNRPTVTGNISLNKVLIIGLALTAVGFGMLLFTTVETIIYSLVGWFTYVVLYTIWSKRRYTINTLIGSVSGAVTPLIGWSGVASTAQLVPWMLFLTLLIWQMPHTYAIAMRKYEEYKKANVAMLPVVRGFAVTKRQMAAFVACLLPIPFFLQLHVAFIVISTLLNVTWLALSICGLFTKNDRKYADISFMFSVHYLTIFFILLIVAAP